MAPLAEAAIDILIAVLATAAVGFTVGEVSSIIDPQLKQLDLIHDATTLAADIHTLEDSVKAQFAGQKGQTLSNLYTGLHAAVVAGEVPPGDTENAMAYILATNEYAGVPVAQITPAQLTDLFKSYGDALKSSTTSTTTHTTGLPELGGHSTGNLESAQGAVAEATSTETISANLPSSLSGTQGATWVTEAEKGLPTTTVAIPGMDPATAQGVSALLDATYSNALAVTAKVASTISDEVSSIDGSISQIRGNLSDLLVKLDNAEATTSGVAQALAAQLGGITAALDQLGAAVGSIDQHLSRLEAEVAAITVGTTSPDLSGIQDEISGIDAQLPGFATIDQLNQVRSTADTALTDATSTIAELAGIGVLGLVATIADLEICCESNSEVTGPIRAGGATTGLLSGLGSLLAKGAELLALGAFFDFLAGVFLMELPDQLAIFEATAIADPVAKIVSLASQNLGWTDQLQTP